MLITSLNTKIGSYKEIGVSETAHKEGTTLKGMAVKLSYVTPEEFDAWVPRIWQERSIKFKKVFLLKELNQINLIELF